jgi:hypothetical protein
MWVMLLPTKDGAPSAIKHVQVEAKTKSGRKLHALRIDHPGGGGVSSRKSFQGILHGTRRATLGHHGIFATT